MNYKYSIIVNKQYQKYFPIWDKAFEYATNDRSKISIYLSSLRRACNNQAIVDSISELTMLLMTGYIIGGEFEI